MSWKAASSFPYKVSRPAQPKQAMPSKYPRTRHTPGVSRATPRPEFLSPMLWRRESPWHLQPNGYRPGVRVESVKQPGVTEIRSWGAHKPNGHRMGAHAVGRGAGRGMRSAIPGRGCDVRWADLLDQCKRDVRAPQVFRRDEGPVLPEMFHACRHVSMRCESTRRPRKSESAA